MSPYQVQVVDKAGVPVPVYTDPTDIVLGEEFSLLPENPEIWKNVSPPFEIPGAAENSPSAFFPAGVMQFSMINNELWLIQ